MTAAARGAAGVPSEVERLLLLEPDGEDAFISTIETRRNLPRIFGGQVAAQALIAACRTVPDERPPHSLHAYFVRPGTNGVPVHYHVDRVHDGGSFSTRHVTAWQHNDAIFEFLASFEHPEPGPEWQSPPPEVGDVPDAPTGGAAARLAHMAGHLDIRPVYEELAAEGWRLHPYWVRTRPSIGDDSSLNAAMLTYVSDIALMAGARQPGTNEPMSAVASIDHALWFHRLPRVDEWHLFSTDSIVNIGARGTVRGAFHTQHGDLVATVTQEALLRPASRTNVESLGRAPRIDSRARADETVASQVRGRETSRRTRAP